MPYHIWYQILRRSIVHVSIFNYHKRLIKNEINTIRFSDCTWHFNYKANQHHLYKLTKYLKFRTTSNYTYLIVFIALFQIIVNNHKTYRLHPTEKYQTFGCRRWRRSSHKRDYTNHENGRGPSTTAFSYVLECQFWDIVGIPWRKIIVES